MLICGIQEGDSHGIWNNQYRYKTLGSTLCKDAMNLFFLYGNFSLKTDLHNTKSCLIFHMEYDCQN